MSTHADFKSVEASRPPWDATASFRITQTADPSWKLGSGANSTHDDNDNDAAQKKQHVAIDPYAAGRPPGFNYKLLISAVVPRPVAFVSTRSADGTVTNLAPFSYFNVVAHDPPLFVIGFVGGLASAKDTLALLVETGECVVNIMSEGFIEAANATAVDAPRGRSEWAVSGLTPKHDCETVRAARVAEAIFSVECKLESVREFASRSKPGTTSTTMAVVEGTRFWAREDAINEDGNLLDPGILRPVGRLGGITYARVTEAFEIQRPDFQKDVGGEQGFEQLKKQAFE